MVAAVAPAGTAVTAALPTTAGVAWAEGGMVAWAEGGMVACAEGGMVAGGQARSQGSWKRAPHTAQGGCAAAAPSSAMPCAPASAAWVRPQVVDSLTCLTGNDS